MSSSGSSSQCPVFFAGGPHHSEGFDTFLSNTQKIPALAVTPINELTHVAQKAQDLDHGILILLLKNKNDLAIILNTLTAFRKRIDSGLVRVMVYGLLDTPKISQLLKSKGCTETLVEGLTQKALVHKLQKHVQIINTKFSTRKRGELAAKEENIAQKAAASRLGLGAGERVGSDSAKLRYVTALVEPNDCWLVKNKKDFRFVRGNWIGEMIGPGPSAGSWIDAGGASKQSVFRWVARSKAGHNVFVPGHGSWFFAGRKPEFDWKTNRWRFIGERPSLFFKVADSPVGSIPIYRFRSVVPGALDVALNSVDAKSKLKAIIATFAEEKLFKDEKKQAPNLGDLKLEKEAPKSRGAFNDQLTPNDEPNEWGELNDQDDDHLSAWNDLSTAGDENTPAIGSGPGVRRSNKLKSDRGVGQGNVASRGYRNGEVGSADLDKFDGLNESAESDANQGSEDENEDEDLTGQEGEIGPSQSARGSAGRSKRPKTATYENEEMGARRKRAKKRRLAGRDTENGTECDGDDEGLGFDADLDDLLGDPAAEAKWETGKAAFDKITLELRLTRVSQTQKPVLSDVLILEREGAMLLLDVPTSQFVPGEQVLLAVVLGQSGKKKQLDMKGVIKKVDPLEPGNEGRQIIRAEMSEASLPNLVEIQGIFEVRQAQLLDFLREAKGYEQ